MEIADWRKQIDAIDPQIVELLNQRATAAKEIGRIKRNLDMPIRENLREREVLRNISRANRGPLADTDLHLIFERIIEVMRNIQKVEIIAEDEPIE